MILSLLLISCLIYTNFLIRKKIIFKIFYIVVTLILILFFSCFIYLFLSTLGFPTFEYIHWLGGERNYILFKSLGLISYQELYIGEAYDFRCDLEYFGIKDNKEFKKNFGYCHYKGLILDKEKAWFKVSDEICFYEYLEKNKIYVGSINNSNEAILKLKENILNLENKSQPNWDKTWAEYQKNSSYAGEILKEGWYIYESFFDSNLSGDSCCNEFFISKQGDLMKIIKHPC